MNGFTAVVIHNVALCVVSSVAFIVTDGNFWSLLPLLFMAKYSEKGAD